MMNTKLPEISDEDRQFLHYNPNTSDVVEWVQEYAKRAVKQNYDTAQHYLAHRTEAYQRIAMLEAALRELKTLVRQAFTDGFFSPETYNDVLLNDEESEWKDSNSAAKLATINKALREE